MNKKFLLPLFTLLILPSCNYGYNNQTILYDNTFSPWPTGVDYSTIIDCNKSHFNCNYESDYSYQLVFKNGDVVKYDGKYTYINESFMLYYDNEVVLIIKKANYYEFIEKITFEEKEYTIIWHAQHIFD